MSVGSREVKVCIYWKEGGKVARKEGRKGERKEGRKDRKKEGKKERRKKGERGCIDSHALKLCQERTPPSRTLVLFLSFCNPFHT